MISREEAILTCYELIGSGILDEELELKIQDIASCIEAECIGRHEWGVDSSILSVLYSAKRADLITDEDIEKYDDSHRLLTFIPSVDERAIIERNVVNKIEDATGECAKAEDIDDWFRRD